MRRKKRRKIAAGPVSVFAHFGPIVWNFAFGIGSLSRPCGLCQIGTARARLGKAAQEVRGFEMARGGGDREWSAAVGVSGCGIGAGSQQQCDGLSSPGAGGGMKRCAAKVVGSDCGLTGKEHVRQGRIAMGGGEV